MTNDGWSKEWPVPADKGRVEVWEQNDKNSVWDGPTNQTEMNEWFKKQPDMMAAKIATPNPTIDPEGFVESLWPKIMTGAQIAEAQVEAKKAEDKIINSALQSIGNRIIKTIDKEYNNKVPTHDPYTNPNAHIYHECACGAILDPGTKSFAALNNAASNAGWKIRWGVEHYKAYCVKCGEDVE